MPSQRFDALFIDFFGTVAAGDRAAVEAACDHIVRTLDLPIDAQEFAVRWGEIFFATIDRSNHESFRTLYECELTSLTDTLRELFDMEADPEPLVAPLESYWRRPGLQPEAKEALSLIHLPTCCVSNADTAPLLMALRHHDLRFDRVISSEDVRCYKPDPVIFERAVEQMGVSPDRVAHVGDSRHSDVAGAAKLGITTIWLHREDRIHDIGNCSPDHTIRSLLELPALIG